VLYNTGKKLKKIATISILFVLYAAYSGWVYTTGTDCVKPMEVAAIRGKAIWHNKNCQNCHQIYGLGGYMGPDLTTVTADRNRGIPYARGILMHGTARMPDYHFSERSIEDIIAYLSYVNITSAAMSK
jgi:nitric oxide reductase subunit C